MITLITVLDLNNDDLDGYQGSVKYGHRLSHLVTSGRRWSHWSVIRSRTSTMVSLMVILLLKLVICKLEKKKEKEEKDDL